MSCDLCAKCGGAMASVNFMKKVDPMPNNKYGNFFGDSSQGSSFRPQRAPAIQMCIPTIVNPPPPQLAHRSIVQVPCDPPKPCPRFVCEPCPPPSPTKVWLIKSSPTPQKVWFNKFLMFLLSFAIAQPPPCIPISVCIPIGPSSQEEPDGKVMCLPCVPLTPDFAKPKKKAEPVGLVTQNKDMDLIGGKIIETCTCGRMNGLNGEDCPRVSCQNNPGCTMSPPMCWPQFKEPKPPPPAPPDQKIICIPVELVYEQPPK